MKTNIYYFSGTGNSLAIAGALARELEGQATVVPMVALAKQERVTVRADVIGLVCPTYFLTIPDMVGSFVGRLTFESVPYVFSVVTCNDRPGRSLHVISALLRRKGQTMSLGRAVNMPGNSLIGMDLTNPPRVRQERLDNSLRSVGEIAGAVRNRQTAVPDGTDSPGVRLRSLFMSSFVKYVYRPARAFRVEGACARCGTCMRVCPVGNITLDEAGPRWGRECVYCLACLHWCPQQAIEMRKDTPGRLRYHHPAITVDDMAAQSHARSLPLRLSGGGFIFPL